MRCRSRWAPAPCRRRASAPPPAARGLACASNSVATACATLAWAVASAARERATGRAAWRCRARPAPGPFHVVVHVHQHARHRARELAADVDRARRLQRAVGADGDVERGALHRLGDVARCRGGAPPDCHHASGERDQPDHGGHAAPQARRCHQGGRRVVEQRGNVRRRWRGQSVFMRSCSRKRAAASSRRPGPEEAHVVAGDVGVAAGHAVPRGPAGCALRRQHGLEVDQAAGVTLARQQRALSAASAAARRRAGSRSPCRATSASSTSFSALPARWRGGARLVERGLLGIALGAQRAAVEDRQRHAGEQRTRPRRRRPSGRQRERRQAERAAQAEAGVARRGLGLHHALRRRADARLGGAHVNGSLAQRCRPGRRARDRRPAAAPAPRPAARARPTVRPVSSASWWRDCAIAGLQRRHLGARLLDRGAPCSASSEVARPACTRHSVMRSVSSLAGEVLARDHEAALGAAQRDVALATSAATVTCTSPRLAALACRRARRHSRAARWPPKTSGSQLASKPARNRLLATPPA